MEMTERVCSMNPTTSIDPATMQQYRETARRRGAALARQRDERRTRAWEVARAAGDLLQERFHASRVWVFGSLLQDDLFHDHSDVDIAAWGVRQGGHPQSCCGGYQPGPGYLRGSRCLRRCLGKSASNHPGLRKADMNGANEVYPAWPVGLSRFFRTRSGLPSGLECCWARPANPGTSVTWMVWL
jgi:hypothetical protein